jgi:hypothetical protein
MVIVMPQGVKTNNANTRDVTNPTSAIDLRYSLLDSQTANYTALSTSKFGLLKQ